VFTLYHNLDGAETVRIHVATFDANRTPNRARGISARHAAQRDARACHAIATASERARR